MLHYSPAKKNKHQNDYETIPEEYLYMDHKLAKNVSSRPSREIRAELDDNISHMRRHFKRTVKRLRRSIYYTNWLKNVPESTEPIERMRLRSRHA